MTGCQKGHLLKCPGASAWETSKTTFSTSAHAAGDSRQSFAVYVCPWKTAGRHRFVHRGCGQCAVPWIVKQKLRQANTLLGGTVEELQFMPFLAQIRYYLEASVSSSSSSTYFGQIHFSSSVGPAWVPLKSVSCSGLWVKACLVACLVAWGFVWLSEGGSRRLSWPLPSVWGNIRQNLVALLHRVYIWRLLLFQTGPKSQQPMGWTFLKWQCRNY